MDFNEYPLLHDQDLMIVLLRLGAAKPSSLDDALARLRADLTLAREAPPVTDQEIRDHLADARFRLMTARLLEPAGRSRFRTTTRGRRALADHPRGIDDSVLMAYPEFRAYVERAARPRGSDDPKLAEYHEGHAAFRDGRSLDDNPYEWDAARHLAWENGWSDARDLGRGRTDYTHGNEIHAGKARRIW